MAGFYDPVSDAHIDAATEGGGRKRADAHVAVCGDDVANGRKQRGDSVSVFRRDRRRSAGQRACGLVVVVALVIADERES